VAPEAGNRSRDGTGRYTVPVFVPAMTGLAVKARSINARRLTRLLGWHGQERFCEPSLEANAQEESWNALYD